VSVNTTRSHAVAKILPHSTFGGSRHRPHVTWPFDTPYRMLFPIGCPLD